MTGGTFAIANDFRANPQSASLYLNPQTQIIANNHSIIFGTSETVAEGENFTLYAANPIERLEINNPANVEPKVTLESVPLVLNGDLFGDNNATPWKANGFKIFDAQRVYWEPNMGKIYLGQRETQGYLFERNPMAPTKFSRGKPKFFTETLF